MSAFALWVMLAIPTAVANPSRASSAKMPRSVSAVNVSSVPTDTVVNPVTARTSARKQLVVLVPSVMLANVCVPWATLEIRMISPRAAAFVDSVATMPTVVRPRSVSNWARDCASASMPAQRFSVDPMHSALPMITARPVFAPMDTLEIPAICKWAANLNGRCLI